MPDREAAPISLLLFDIGGVIYDDRCYAEALKLAIIELSGAIDPAEFDLLYRRTLQDPGPGLRARAAAHFEIDRAQLTALVERHWHYDESALYPEVEEVLARLAGRYRLGIVANQTERVRDALARDRLIDLFDVLVLSGEVGIEKPSPRLFSIALERARTEAALAVHVGNRFANDVLSARAAGIRPIWVLRGEAPPAPTGEQLARAAAVTADLHGVEFALARLEGDSRD